MTSCDIKLKLSASLSSMMETKEDALCCMHEKDQLSCSLVDAEPENSNNMVLEPQGGCKWYRGLAFPSLAVLMRNGTNYSLK